MQERSSKEEALKDVNTLVARIVEEATTEPNEKNPHAVALGQLGGKRGGIARAKKLTAGRRSEIAKKAAQARWGKSESKT